ncbi:TetR/AcrR family transcriptional regulator [Streptomyces europaeiscabiei]|uniref:TetR/AcrR family transcriptional regulator n=1 Tax=Streptomyces europaeiscabiei TaxID=146819 RepID=UPI0029AB4A0F|nr:TetR/AcrR family transcriptional regulator [Streptomyces europaeiscabiei]MDX2529897.1 TetR/AcrR family transcriptional regulator [Streptomyces europaeiscabiei]MDX3778590.1 TetR/AcrR family transcriptional regulator [Streptomyces europaeiscabiei]
MPTKKKPRATAAAPARRGELLDRAANVFADLGYNATTVRRIADDAGMLAGSLYYYFESKDAMLEEILRTFLDELWERYDTVLDAGTGPRDTFESLVTESFRAIDRHCAAVRIYQNEAKQLIAQERRFFFLEQSQTKFEKAWLSTLERGVALGQLRADLDTRVTYRFVRDTVWVAASWYRPNGKYSPEEIARQYLSMVLDGIAVRESGT